MPLHVCHLNTNNYHIDIRLGSVAQRLLEKLILTSWLQGSFEDERVSLMTAKVQIIIESTKDLLRFLMCLKKKSHY